MATFLPRSRTYVDMNGGEVITSLPRKSFEYSTDVGRNLSYPSACTQGSRQVYENLFDPISGCLAAGYTQIPTLDQVSDKPNAVLPPHRTHSIRVHCVSAPPDTRRLTERDPGSPYLWNSRRLLDATIRANLRTGHQWTVCTKTRLEHSHVHIINGQIRQVRIEQRKVDELNAEVFDGNDNSTADYADGTYKEGSNIEDPKFLANHPLSRDDMAKRYMYRSSTQSAYEQVPWDMKLHPKRWKPVSTMEGFSSQPLYRVRPPTLPPSCSFTKSTENWDRNQLRRNHAQQNTLHQNHKGYGHHVEEIPTFSSRPTDARLSVI